MNNKRLLQNTAAAFLIKGASAAVSLWMMPAYLAYFREEGALGSWFTLQAMLNWLLVLDLGMNNGLRNHLTQALARGEVQRAREDISAAYGTLGILCLTVSGGFFLLFPRAAAAVKIGVLGAMAQLWLRLVSAVLYARQLSAGNDLLELCSSLLTLLCLYLFAGGGLPVMAMIRSAAACIPLAAATVWVFSDSRLRPRIKQLPLAVGRQLWSLGGGFFLVQMGYLVMMNTNEYLIHHHVGPDAVVEYQIIQKLFLLAGSLFSLVLTPVWSAVTQAMAQGNRQWIRRLYRRLCLLAAVGTAGMFGILPVLQPLLRLWLGDQGAAVSAKGAFWAAALGALLLWNGVLSSMANGLGRLKTQLCCFLAGALIKFPLVYLLAEQTGAWYGVAAANVLVLLPYCLAEPISLAKFFRKQEKIHE